MSVTLLPPSAWRNARKICSSVCPFLATCVSSSCSPRGPRPPFQTQLIRGSLFGFWVICEQLDYNLLFRWFLDMDVAEPSFDHSTFSRNRARLLEHDVAREFFTRVVAQARSLQLLSDEHFTVDGTLVEAWASVLRKYSAPVTQRERRGCTRGEVR